MTSATGIIEKARREGRLVLTEIDCPNAVAACVLAVHVRMARRQHAYKNGIVSVQVARHLLLLRDDDARGFAGWEARASRRHGTAVERNGVVGVNHSSHTVADNYTRRGVDIELAVCQTVVAG